MESLENEIWKDVEVYEGIYQVSNIGRVKSMSRYIPYKIEGMYAYRNGRILINAVSSAGYHRVFLKKPGKCKPMSVHRLVAFAFIPNYGNKPFVNHINGIKSDNRVENLEWCTASENNIHAFKIGLCSQKGDKNAYSKLSSTDVISIRKMKKDNPEYTYKYISTFFNVGEDQISVIIKRKQWAHI